MDETLRVRRAALEKGRRRNSLEEKADAAAAVGRLVVRLAVHEARLRGAAQNELAHLVEHPDEYCERQRGQPPEPPANSAHWSARAPRITSLVDQHSTSASNSTCYNYLLLYLYSYFF